MIIKVMNQSINIKIPFTTLIMLGLILAGPVKGQTTEDFQTWGSVTAIGSLSVLNPDLQKFKYWLEGHGRFGNDTSRFSQGILRTGLGYAVNENTSVWLGYAWVPTDEPFAKKAFDENRIWQQLLWSHKYSLATVTSRSRFEQRFIPAGSQVGWRFRQLLKISVPLSFAPSFSLVASDEYFANLNKTNWGADDGFDQNRAFAGVGFNFDKHTKTEVGYMNQYIRKAVGPDRMDHILSVNLLLNY